MSDAKAAVEAIRAKTKYQPVVAIILGSGLGGLADDVQGADRIPYASIPGWHRWKRCGGGSDRMSRHAAATSSPSTI